MKIIFTLAVFIFNSIQISAQIIDSLSIDSKILNKQIKCLVYTPKNCNQTNRNVLYLLHGAFGNHKQWIEQGNLKAIIDSMNDFKNCIILMPDAGMTYYMNDEDGRYLYEDFFMMELMPVFEKKYQCGGSKEKRIISGLSMGGFGALLYSFHHPELFAACFAFSPGIRTNDEIINLKKEEYGIRYGFKYADYPEKRINQHWNKNDLLYLSDSMSISDLIKTRYFIDIGDDDFLYKGNIQLYLNLKNRKIPFEFSIRNGEHNWVYWQESIKIALPIMMKILP
jgi:S-formylglutathione hydrolase FrmB